MQHSCDDNQACCASCQWLAKVNLCRPWRDRGCVVSTENALGRMAVCFVMFFSSCWFLRRMRQAEIVRWQRWTQCDWQVFEAEVDVEACYCE